MIKRNIRKLVLKNTEGIISSLTDLVLWNLFYLAEISPFRNATNLRKAEYLAYKKLDEFNYQSIKRVLKNTKRRGWIKENLVLSKEGEKRLENLTPSYFGKRKWDRNWYLVSYDVPEKRRRDRDILRENLKRLGFGEMHASMWVSPFNFLGEIEKVIKDYSLFPFVILAISNKVGKRESRELVNRIWKLDKINQEYKNLIKKTKNKSIDSLIFEYFSILEKDPQLPSDLLPEDWLGDKTHSVFKKYFIYLR